MKIVISPAKSLNFSKEIPFKDFTFPIFENEILEINERLKKLSPSELSSLMKISDKLAQLNWTRNQEFQLPFNEKNSRQALYAFDGDVYDGLDAYSLDNKEVTKAQKHLRILSGQYGILKPLDFIQPYRLEMGTKINIGNSLNLYEFWKEKITHYLNSELSDNELFINLASNEYFNVIDTKKLKVPIITPIFKDWKSGELKVISFYAKKARGLMVRYLIKNEISSVEDIKGFDYQGYSFNHELSSEKELIFVR